MIYHLTTSKIWEEALRLEIYITSSLKTEGFIHCSFRDQVIQSANLHFKEESELILLHIVDKRLGDLLKIEPSRNGELFPHIYGPLPLEAIEDQTILQRNNQTQLFQW
ncbi:MAG: DUF952 domain-containing protein [Sphingobacteriia bacterium]|jgi:uncharacterized protein (DUF952 family)|nr:DUF952 domain-containing protein [Sphingobacteriia bacterium]